MGALGSAALNWQACLGDFKGERGSPVSGAGSGPAAVGNVEGPRRPGERAGREPAGGGPRSPAERRARPQGAAGAGPGGGGGGAGGSAAGAASHPGAPHCSPAASFRAAFRRRGLPGRSEGRREELPPSGSARPAAGAAGPPASGCARTQQLGGVRRANG